MILRLVRVLDAAPAPSGGDPITGALTSIATSSILGACAVLGLFVMWMWLRRETARADRNEQALAAQNSQMQEKVIPILAEAARVLAEGQSGNREMARLLADATAALRDAQPSRERR